MQIMTIVKGFLHHIVFSVVLIMFLVMLWLMFYPFQISNIRSLTIENKDGIVCRGGYLNYNVKVDKYYEIPGTLIRVITDGWSYTYPEMSTAMPKGHNDRSATLEIPLRSVIGKFRFSYAAIYTVFGRQFISRSPYAEFEIVNCDSKGNPIKMK
jgi:hypothetical protein